MIIYTPLHEKSFARVRMFYPNEGYRSVTPLDAARGSTGRFSIISIMRYEYSLYSRLSFQEQHTWYLVRYMQQAPNRLYKSGIRGSVSRVKTPCEQGLPHCTYVRATSRAMPSSHMRRRRRSAVSPWNVDPLRSTTLRGIRSARSGLGRQWSFRASALHRKSCYASVSVMLEKRGGRCRTDGPMRVLSCQMRHTIAAIKAAWCRSLC